MKGLLVFLMIGLLALPVSAAELTPPQVPECGRAYMPQDTASFSDALGELFQKAIQFLRPDWAEALKTGVSVIVIALLAAMLEPLSEQAGKCGILCGTAAICVKLLTGVNSLMSQGIQTIRQLSEYGKLLLPVMTAGLAAQGGATSAGVLYTATAFANAVLTSLMSEVFVPCVYLYLGLSAADCFLDKQVLSKTAAFLKSAISWCLKILLTVFTTYVGISGAVAGTTDAALLKTTKVTIASVVPVVGGILSDASEAVLTGAEFMKNSAGIYGILAILAIVVHPFLRTGMYYLVLQLSTAVCGIFGGKELSGLVSAFSTAMGLLLAMTAGSCMILLVSMICFLKGVG